MIWGYPYFWKHPLGLRVFWLLCVIQLCVDLFFPSNGAQKDEMWLEWKYITTAIKQWKGWVIFGVEWSLNFFVRHEQKKSEFFGVSGSWKNFRPPPQLSEEKTIRNTPWTCAISWWIFCWVKQFWVFVEWIQRLNVLESFMLEVQQKGVWICWCVGQFSLRTFVQKPLQKALNPPRGDFF